MSPRLSIAWLLLWLASCGLEGASAEDKASTFENLCEGQSFVLKTNVFRHADVPQTAVDALFKQVSEYYAKEGITLSLEAVAWYIASSAGEPKPENSEGADWAFYIGPTDWGVGYWGPPYYVATLGTTAPFDAETLRYAVYLLNNYLGQQWLGLSPAESYPKDSCVQRDLMYLGGTPLEQSTFCRATKRVLCFNLQRVAAEGKNGIYTPHPEPDHPPGVQCRMGADVLFRAKVKNSKDRCMVYRAVYNSDRQVEEFESSPFDVELPSERSTIYFSLQFVSWYDGVKIVCGPESYFVPNPVFDECFFHNNASTVRACGLSCLLPASLCEVD